MEREGAKITRELPKSILVPSVQELAKECLEKVPERYVQPFGDQDCPIFQVDDHDYYGNHELPIINMEALLDGDQQELQKLHSACKEWGFFQLINHGVSPSLLEKFKKGTQEFFSLPMEEKKKYWQTPNHVEGFGQAFVVSDQQKLDWADLFYLTTLPKTKRTPRLFPCLPTPYRDTMEDYSSETATLAKRILGCMAKALGIDTDVMMEVFGEGQQTLRINYYPPCPQPEKVIGLSPHSDGIALTILLQINEMEGLQIMKDGKWISVRALPHAFVVNIGDILEIITNGIYRSVLHRAVVNATKERLSAAVFYMPADDQEIGPIHDLLTPDTPAKFVRINMIDFFHGYLSQKLESKSYLDVMRINKND